MVSDMVAGTLQEHKLNQCFIQVSRAQKTYLMLQFWRNHIRSGRLLIVLISYYKDLYVKGFREDFLGLPPRNQNAIQDCSEGHIVLP